MQNFFSLIRRHKIWTFAILLGVLVVGVILVLLYRQSAPCDNCTPAPTVTAPHQSNPPKTKKNAAAQPQTNPQSPKSPTSTTTPAKPKSDPSQTSNNTTSNGSVTPPTTPTGRTWPSGAGTGASGSLTTINQDVVLDSDYNGQTYQDKHINGALVVTGCNVTLRNIEIYGGSTGADYYALWLQHPDTCSVSVDHVTIVAGAAPNNFVSTGVRVAFGSPVTITNSKIIGTQDGINGVGSGLIQGNYIELGSSLNGEHNDGIQTGGSDGLTIKHNTILNPNSQTSALALFTEFGSNKNLLVQDNLLAGGGYTCYCGDGAQDNNGNPARSVNVDFIDNVFWRRYFADVGSFGSGRAYNPAGGGEWTNNLYMNANGAMTNGLTSEQVPQPPIDQ